MTSLAMRSDTGEKKVYGANSAPVKRIDVRNNRAQALSLDSEELGYGQHVTLARHRNAWGQATLRHEAALRDERSHHSRVDASEVAVLELNENGAMPAPAPILR